MGVALELIDKRGSYYSYGEERLGQGRENAKQYLREHPEMALELDAEVRAAAGIGPKIESSIPDLIEDEDSIEQLETVLDGR
jgi:recombination protein RecA